MSPQYEWTTLAAFAVERRWLPRRLPELGAGAPVSASGWREVGRDGRWRLLLGP
ncbi:hypothetical protein JRI60_51875 [Archangium violaceum]|uniref:hypothetical protein n=1 Tax=Archangium violaceum TaxID=83451 RepID=UPI00195172B5|nr:hypothetical protein [Archangium violaceum]QRN97352.1 hypothetical protein JRI60_51875 [Archangium violaceum]